MHIIWITTQFPNGIKNRDGMFIYRTVQELGKHYRITVLVMYPVIPPFIPMLKNLKDWKKIYSNWKSAFPSKPEIPPGLENIEVHYVKYARPPRINYLDVEGWFAYQALKKYFIKISLKNNNIIHAAWIFPSGHAAELLSKKFRIPFIVTLMGSDVNLIQLNTLRHSLAKRIINKADMVSSVSKFLLDELIKKEILPANKPAALTHTVYNFSKFSIKDRGITRNNLSIDKDKKVILFAGMLRKLKNADVLINSIEMLKNKYDILLFIAGAGYEEGNLKRLVALNNITNRVKFLGNIDEDSLVEYYNAADIFCLPSKSEGLPNVIVEALLCGTPVVATRVGEIPIIIKDGENGYIVEANSVQSLSAGIKNVLSRKWNRRILRESVSFLEASNVIREYDNVYNDVVNNHLRSFTAFNINHSIK